MTSSTFGSTLVTGGCGFLGSHLVAELLKEPGCGPITVISRNPTANLHNGVQYRACDLTDATQLQSIIDETKPQTVFHTASPTSADFNTPMEEFWKGNVVGTETLLACIAKTRTVKALVFSSTVSVIEGEQHFASPESTPYWRKPGGDCLPYYWSKTIAEQKILEANKEVPGLVTAALRLCLMYGPGDRQCVPNLVDAVKGGQSNVQLGDNTNEIDLVSVVGAAKAHLLTARLLLDPTKANGQVAGEAFNITDGVTIRFWDFMRLVYRLAGDTTKPEDIKVVPAWLGMTLATVAEGFYSIVTWGRRRPTQLNRTIVTHSIRTYTYDISKARRVLGYQPAPKLEEGMKEAVRYEFKKRGEVPPESAS